MDDPYGSSRGTHNYPSPNAARSHTHSAANLCPKPPAPDTQEHADKVRLLRYNGVQL